MLKQRIAHFEEAICGFERTRDELLRRRRNAAAHIVAELDERLEVSTRALRTLKQNLDLVKAELRREEAKTLERT